MVYDAPLTVPTTLLALVLLVSGGAKLAALSTAADAFVSLRLPPVLLRLQAPRLLPIGEIVLAVALLVCSGWLGVVVTVLAMLLFVAYFVIIVRALGFDEAVTCSCFGKLGLGSVDRFTAVRNAILVALSAVAVYDATRGASVIARFSRFDGAEWAWLAGVLAAVALTWLISGHRGDASTPVSGGPTAEGDYLRAPIPFARLRTPNDAPVTLRDLARTEPVLLLVVSPTCGSCRDVIEKARAWQHTVPGLRTILVLPMPVMTEPHGLIDPVDFDILFDPQNELLQLLESGTPTALLLGADGLLAGGPVMGGPFVEEFLDDVAAELAEQQGRSSEAADDAHVAPDPQDTSTSLAAAGSTDHDGGVSTVVTPGTTSGPTHADASAAAPVADEMGEGEYERRPTPYALLEDGTGLRVPLLTLGDAGPAVVLYVSPSCGSCLAVIDAAPQWEEQLRGVPVYYLVMAPHQVDALTGRGVAPERVLVDELGAVAQTMQIGTPSLFAVGADRHLLAGPVSGTEAIGETMEAIIDEVSSVRPETVAHDGPDTDEFDEGAAAIPNDTSETLESTVRPAAGDVVDLAALVGADGEPISSLSAGGRSTALVFLSPDCEACHEVAARVDAWRANLPEWDVRIVVPDAPSTFEPTRYGAKIAPSLFDPTYAFGASLALASPAVVTLDAEGRLRGEPAIGQAECYRLVRELRAAR